MTKKHHIEVEGRELTISNVEKVYFPSSGFTRGQVISFYSEIAEVIVPHLRDRPLTLKRFPEGIKGEHFYEKNAPSHTPSWVNRFAVARSEGGSDIHYVIAGVKRSEYQRCESASPSFLGNLLSLSRKASRNLRLPSGVGDRSRADFMNQIAAPIVRHAEVRPPPPHFCHPFKDAL